MSEEIISKTNQSDIKERSPGDGTSPKLSINSKTKQRGWMHSRLSPFQRRRFQSYFSLLSHSQSEAYCTVATMVIYKSRQAGEGAEAET